MIKELAEEEPSQSEIMLMELTEDRDKDEETGHGGRG